MDDARPEDEVPPAAADQGRALPGLRDALDRFATEYVLYIGSTGKVRSVNKGFVLGYDGDERLGAHIGEYLHPDDLPALFDVIERARATSGFSDHLTVRARHADGSWHTFHCFIQDASVVEAGMEGALIRARDVTDELPAAAIARGAEDENDRFLSLAEAVPLGILSADARGFVVFANHAARDLFDMTVEALSGEGWTRAVLPSDREDVADAMRAVISAGRPQEVTFRLGTGLFIRWCHARFVPLGGAATTGWIATIDDVTDRRRSESHLAHLATHDSLTHLPNRSLLEDRLRQACRRLRRDGQMLSVLFVDLDGFKAVNDDHGHAVGDRALVEVARRLRHVVRDVDTVARLGGDEFVVVAEDLDEAGAAEIADRIEEAVRMPIMASGAALTIGASVGVIASADAEADVADLLNRADQAMYRVKQAHHGASSV